MSDPMRPNGPRTLEPVHTDEEERTHRWTARLVLFVRIMAALSLLKGLWHWAEVTGILVGAEGGFESRSLAWQSATTFFAVIDLVVRQDVRRDADAALAEVVGDLIEDVRTHDVGERLVRVMSQPEDCDGCDGDAGHRGLLE